MPEEKVVNQRFDGVDYLKWKNEGWIRTFTDNRTEHDEIAKQMIIEMDKYDIRSIGYDAKYFASGVAPHLKTTKYLELCNAVGQGYSGLSAAVNEVEGWAVTQKMDLNRNPVLSWCFNNTELKTGDQGDRIPSKRLSTGRIDGVSATLDAVAEYLRSGAEPPKNPKRVLMI